MMSDHDISMAINQGDVKIFPIPAPEAFQPASVDVTLGDSIVRMDHGEEAHTFSGGVSLAPGEFALCSTLERITLGDSVAARFEGKSSLGRLGLLTHVTAGFIDPGFTGTVTVELKNLSNREIILRPGMYIGQLCFFRLDSPADQPYAGHYNGQTGATKSVLNRRGE